MLRPLFAALLGSGLLFAQGYNSPAATTSVAIDGKSVHIDYHTPSMHGRKIFGGLVPYGKIWRAGANEATALHTDAELDLGGLKIPKGDYTLYVYPEANQWKLVVSKQTGQWGTVYNEGQDLGRVEMKLSAAPTSVDTWKITLSQSGPHAGKLRREWENTVAELPFTVR
jgi:hypothetical protein